MLSLMVGQVVIYYLTMLIKYFIEHIEYLWCNAIIINLLAVTKTEAHIYFEVHYKNIFLSPVHDNFLWDACTYQNNDISGIYQRFNCWTDIAM